jgi:tRNA(Ile)-lysidine synthase
MPAAPKNAKHFRIKNQVLRTVEQVITAHAMFKSNEKVLVGVSGGSDSVALLHVLLELTPRYAFTLGIAHLNHGLRGREANADAEFVSSLARKYALPFYTEKRNTRQYQTRYKLSLEEAARQIRYAFFIEVAKKYGFDKIALGHQANDNAENVLMYLLRGSGTRGLSGIPPIREGKIVRPLLGITKSQIENYLAAAGLASVTDRSNAELQFTRNRLRHQLLPVLISSYNPRLIETLNRLAEIMRAEERWIRDTVTPVFDDLIVEKTAGILTLSVPALHAVQTAVLRRIIRMALETVKGDLRRITFTHIESTRKLLGKNWAYGHLNLPGHITIRRQGDKLLIYREKDAPKHHRLKPGNYRDHVFSYPVPAPGLKPVVVKIKETGARLVFTITRAGNIADIRKAGQHVAFFDMHGLTFPLTIRNLRPGDRFNPLGMTGTQKVKDFFINRKIPRSNRSRYPLLLNLDRIIWVAGHRIDHSVRVTDATENILKVELFLAE